MTFNLVNIDFKQHDTVTIYTHVSPDLDATGSQYGLAKILKHNYPHLDVHCLGTIHPYFTNKVEPSEISEEVIKNSLAIVVDTANSERVSDSSFKLANNVIKIDHHIASQKDLEDFPKSIININSAACAELIVEICLELGWEIPKESAELLYAGILGDTGSFSYSNVTRKTFEVAANLIELGIDYTKISNDTKAIHFNTLQLRSEVVLNSTISNDGLIVAHVSKELIERYGVTEDTAANTVGVFNGVLDVKIWVMFIESDYGTRVRIRSREKEIRPVAVMFGGGGHPLASGCTINSKEEQEQLISELKKLL